MVRFILLFVVLQLVACGSDGGDRATTSTGIPTVTSTSGSGVSTSSAGGGGSGGEGEGGDAGHGGQGGHAGQGGQGGAPGAIRVLFVGNSYTYVNDLPLLVQTIDSGGPTITTGAATAGGAQLITHAGNSAVADAIAMGWDAVVLQGQSVEPLLVPDQFFDGAGDLAALIAPTGARIAFFETWARAPGHAVYQEVWSGGNPMAMQAGLRAAYSQAAQDHGGVMVPAGDAWEQSLAMHPIVLHSGDGSHPSLAGSYLAAAVFNLVLTQRTAFASPAPAPAGLSEVDAGLLRTVAEAAVVP